MPVYYDQTRKHWRWRYRGRICGIKVCLSGTPAINTKRAAEQDERLAIERKRNELESPILTRDVPTLSEWHNAYMDMQRRDNTAGTVAVREKHFRLHILPRWRNKRLDEFVRAEIQGWIDELRDRFSVGHTCSIVNSLMGCLRYAQAQEVIAHVPRIELPLNKQMKDDFLPEEEVLALWEACRTPEERLVIAAGARAGLRNGEIRGLQPGDYHHEARTLRILRQVLRKGVVTKPKGNRQRTVPVHADLAAAIEECAADGRKWLLTHSKAGGPWSESKLSRCLAKIAKRAGGEEMAKRVHPHLLRHTCASHLAIRGVSLYIVANILGHTNLRTTERYAKLSPAANLSAIDLIPAAAGKTEPSGAPPALAVVQPEADVIAA